MLYRLLTEDKNRIALFELVSQDFNSFTVLPAIGYWRGSPEVSLAIEIDSNNGNVKAKIGRLAERICTLNNQQAVLVQVIHSQSWLVTKPLGVQHDTVEIGIRS